MKKLQLKKEIVERLSTDRTAHVQGGFNISEQTVPPRCDPDFTQESCFCEKPIDTLKGCVYTYGCETFPVDCM